MTGLQNERLDIIELPIFALPDVVFFPNTQMPLHIFETRYKTMINDVLEGDGRIGMTLLRPGWESDYYDKPAVFEVGGMGLVSEHTLLDEGRYNVILSGQSRFRILDFEECAKPYRVARVALLPERISQMPDLGQLSRELIREFSALMNEADRESLEMEFFIKLDFGSLVNAICSSLNLDPFEKQGFLELDDVRERAVKVLSVIREQLSQRQFISRFLHLAPQDPSVN